MRSNESSADGEACSIPEELQGLSAAERENLADLVEGEAIADLYAAGKLVLPTMIEKED